VGGQHESERLAIIVDDVWETFRIYKEAPPGLKERLYRFRRSRFETFDALKGVSLSIRHGESVGLIGHNGSGKSTLLKCLAGILPPDRGAVTTNGRLSTLLELGAGFHQELSGRENVYLNGAILGLSEKEVDTAFDDIVDFAGVREFIDQPVRNYSSGMYVRLGFAVAVHVDPEILLVDEVLSVGDAAFQEKSLARMRAFNQRGNTVVLVSHDLSSIQALCERTIVLDHGRLVFDGPTEDAVEAYEEIVASGKPAPEPEPEEPEEEGRTGDGLARVSDIRFIVDGAELDGPARPGAKAQLEVDVTAHGDLTEHGSLTCGINLRRPDMALYVYETRTSWGGTYLAPPVSGETMTVTFAVELNLLTGDYLLDLLVGNATSNALHDRWPAALSFQVAGPEYEFGVAALDAQISIWNPEGYWPPHLHAPPLERGGPRHAVLREGEEAPAGASGGRGSERGEEAPAGASGGRGSERGEEAPAGADPDAGEEATGSDGGAAPA
jgi:ABC-type polysaccharide/polyol phosphate transport system ATPase subunit